MAYNKSIELVGGLGPKGNSVFPIVQTDDIYVNLVNDAKFPEKMSRLTDWLKANQVSESTISTIVNKIIEDKASSTNSSILELIKTELGKIVDNAPSNYDTLKEIADWIQGSGAEASALVTEVQNLKTEIGDNDSGLVKDVRDLQATIGDGQTLGNVDVIDNVTTTEFEKEGKKLALSAKQGYELQKQIDELNYKVITVSGTVSPDLVEVGTVVNGVKLSWTTNKTPKTLLVNESSVDVSTKTKTLTSLNLTYNQEATKTFDIIVSDEKKSGIKSSPSIVWKYPFYYGVAAAPQTIDSAFVKKLNRLLSSGKMLTTATKVTANSGDYVWIAYPKIASTTELKVYFKSGILTEVKGITHNIKFTNNAGNTSDYIVWQSNEMGLGSLEMYIEY